MFYLFLTEKKTFFKQSNTEQIKKQNNKYLKKLIAIY